MIFVRGGEEIEVMTIRFGEKGHTVMRLWIGADEIQTLVMRLGVKARTEETC